jgi:undecaprenyl-diphosphatase
MPPEAQGLDALSRALIQADHALSDAAAAVVPLAAQQVFAWLTHLGDPAVLALLCGGASAALWLRGHRRLALACVIAVGGNAVLNRTLKHLFERARPTYDKLIAPAEGYSFPSGHSSGAMVAYGMLAYVAVRTLPARWHLPAAVVAACVVLTVASSRVILRVHFAGDVLAGCLSGGAWLALCIAWAEAARRSTARPAHRA